jgi:sorting nexin-1/2
VKNPIKVGGHIRYTVSGLDIDGSFEESRRYKEFFALRTTLAQRWPGIYIPAIPEKKLVGNNDDGFLEERRHLLERFMKECGRLGYVTHSKEFKIFARDKGDIEKIL